MSGADHEWAWAFAEAVCVTAVRGVDRSDVLRRFGGDPTSPTAPTQQEPAVGAEAELRLSPCDDWVVAIEVNGFQGSRPEVLRSVSTDTTAVSAFWNLSAGPEVTLADHGSVRARVELLFDDTAEVHTEDAALAARLEALFDAVKEDRPEFTSVALLEALTGLSLRSTFDGEPGPAYPLVPLLEDHHAHGMYSSLKYDDDELLELLARAAVEDRRRVSRWAARRAVAAAGLADGDALPATEVPASGQPLPHQLAEHVRRLQHEAYEPMSWAGPDHHLPDHEGRSRRGWAAHAVHANANPDDLTAAADAARFAYLAAGSDRSVFDAARAVLAGGEA